MEQLSTCRPQGTQTEALPTIVCGFVSTNRTDRSFAGASRILNRARGPASRSAGKFADYGVSTRGDFEPLLSEKVFYRVQAILDGRFEITAPRRRNDTDFPLRGYVRCETCGKPLTASWSKGRSDYYAHYHCRGRCRAANISKAKLEEMFVDELTRLQPTVGFMRLVKDRVLHAWRDLKADAEQRIVEVERRQKAIQEKLDRLDEVFLYKRSIDIERHDRHRDKLREEFTLVQMDRHATELEELDVEGILAFAERVLPSASNLWVQSSLDQKQRLQQLFFPEGIRFDGKKLVGPGLAPGLQLLKPCFGREKRIGGPDGSRTRDLMNAIHARSQLRYWPTQDVPNSSL